MPRFKLDEHLQCSPRSWLDDFTQPFSWCSSLSWALNFLNKLFLPGVLGFGCYLFGERHQIAVHKIQIHIVVIRMQDFRLGHYCSLRRFKIISSNRTSSQRIIQIWNVKFLFFKSILSPINKYAVKPSSSSGNILKFTTWEILE